LIVAAQKDLVRWHTEVLKAAGLDPRVIDVGSFALVNAVRYGAGMSPETPVALVDIGSALTNIAIMKGETTRFTRDLSTAGVTITRAIVSELGLTDRQAEDAKVEHGISMEDEENGEEEILTISQTNLPDSFIDSDFGETPSVEAEKRIDQEVNAICEQFLGEIVSEIKRCLLFYENQLDGEPVEKVYLTGGTVQMKNADRYVANLLDTSTEILDPFKEISGEVASLDPLTRGSTYAISLGLALRSVIGEGVS
jgi:type IV pilus assembly protein PilM